MRPLAQSIPEAIPSLASQRPVGAGEYIGPDGLIRCSACGEPRQCSIRLPWQNAPAILPCSCGCEAKGLEDERRESYARTRAKSLSMAPAGLQLPYEGRASFESVDASADPYPRLIAYAGRFSSGRRPEPGLLLIGPPGCGKTLAARCIADAALDAGFTALVTSCPRIVNSMADLRGPSRNELADSLCRFGLVVADDFGSERQTDAAREQLFIALDALYRSKATLIVATCMGLRDMKSPPDASRSQIYGRLLEKCAPVSFPDTDWRRARAKGTLEAARAITSPASPEP